MIYWLSQAPMSRHRYTHCTKKIILCTFGFSQLHEPKDDAAVGFTAGITRVQQACS